MKNLVFVYFVLLSCVCCLARDAERAKLDFGDYYDWINDLDEGLKMAERTSKPILLLIHKSWCSACKALRPKFAEDKAIQSLSHKFVMVSLIDDEEPKGKVYKPDGGYIPRILFMSPGGRILRNVFNKNGSEDYKYYYSKTEDIVIPMKKVAEKYRASSAYDSGEL